MQHCRTSKRMDRFYCLGIMRAQAMCQEGGDLPMRETHESGYCELADLADARAELDEIRHHIHQHPELTYEEEATSRFVADKLDALGYDVTRGVGGHGVVASLTAGSGTRTVGVRADMDALPIQERTGLSYASIHDGKM